jgi:hypothetical protein
LTVVELSVASCPLLWELPASGSALVIPQVFPLRQTTKVASLALSALDQLMTCTILTKAAINEFLSIPQKFAN